jgi:hypothetical protein
VRPTRLPMVVEDDPAGLSPGPFKVRQRGFGSSLRWLTTLKRLHDASGEQGSGDAFAVPGESHPPDLVIRVEAAARQR